MKKNIIAIALMTLLMLTSCGHEHTWKEATCTEPKTCTECGETEGEPLGHEMETATCEAPETCKRCGISKGEPLGHLVTDPSCTEDRKCERCGKVIKATGHDWIAATCTEPKTCSICGETEGEPLGHTPGDLIEDNIIEATCEEPGSHDEVIKCEKCGAELSRETVKDKALGHTTDNGVCERCGADFFEAVEGYGDDVISGIELGTGIYKVYFSHSGTSNFAIWCHYADGKRDLLVNTIGSYEGYTLINGKDPVSFEIDADGSWTMQIQSLEVLPTKTSLKGRGDSIEGMFTEIESGTYEISHDGEDNFVIWLHTSEGTDLLVNEIGEYHGKKLIRTSAPGLFEINADGNWTIEKVE